MELSIDSAKAVSRSRNPAASRGMSRSIIAPAKVGTSFTVTLDASDHLTREEKAAINARGLFRGPRRSSALAA